jgi:serine/threonine protein kinase
MQGFHEAGYVHGDLKPGNLCLPFGNVETMPVGGLKAVDVGCSQAVAPVPGSGQRSGRLSKRAGTPVFMAPEVFASDFSFKSDVWAAGVMLYWLFSGAYPVSSMVPDLHSAKLVEIAAAVTTRDATFDGAVWRRLSREGRDFLSRCLCRDESKRPDVDAALAHPWITRLGTAARSDGVARCSPQFQKSLQDQVSAWVTW